MNAQERMVQRIDKAMPRVSVRNPEDALVLKYVRKELSAERIAAREDNEDGDVSHLMTVAAGRLREYEAVSA